MALIAEEKLVDCLEGREKGGALGAIERAVVYHKVEGIRYCGAVGTVDSGRVGWYSQVEACQGDATTGDGAAVGGALEAKVGLG